MTATTFFLTVFACFLGCVAAAFVWGYYGPEW